MENPIIIHLHSIMGTYKVKSYNSKTITVYTHRKEFTVPTSDFKCLAGGRNNAWVSEKRLDEFQSTVSSEYIKAKERQKLEAEAIKAAIEEAEYEMRMWQEFEEIKEQIKKGKIDLGPLSQDQILKAKELDQHLESLNDPEQEEASVWSFTQEEIEEMHAEEMIQEEEMQRLKMESLTEENLEEDDFYDYDCDPNYGLGPTVEEEFEALQKEVDDLYKENRKLTFNLNRAAQKVYNQFIDFSDYQNLEGIKFIIQENNEGSFRFRWDPYQFTENFHSNISDIFRYDGTDYWTVNGGWIKVINDNVYLYSKSGDYGVFDDIIAYHAAKKVFPTKTIHCFAGTKWEEVEEILRAEKL